MGRKEIGSKEECCCTGMWLEEGQGPRAKKVPRKPRSKGQKLDLNTLQRQGLINEAKSQRQVGRSSWKDYWGAGSKFPGEPRVEA